MSKTVIARSEATKQSTWRECKLGDALELKYGKDHKALNDGDIPVYGSGGIMRYADSFLYDKESILIPRKGTLNNIFYIDGVKPFWTVDTIFWSKINTEKVFGKFLFYYLKTIDFANLNVGSAVPSLTTKVLNEIEISIPPLKEQKAIAEVLSSFDDKIDLLHRQNKTLEEMAQTLFRQWFIEEANDEWEIVTVGDFVKTNSSSIKKDCTLSTIQYLDTSSLTEGKIDTLQLLDLADAPSRARRIVKHNDILISTVRPNQKHYGIMKNPTEDIIVSTGFCVISCEKINPHFIYMLLTTDDMTEYLHSIAEGSTSTYPSLKPSDVEAVEFLLPPEEKLKVFSDYADNAWDKIDSNYIQMKTLENMRDTLLPKLMSGEVRVEI